MLKKLLTGLLLAVLLVGLVAVPSLATLTVDDYTIVDGISYLPGDEVAGLRDQYSETFYGGNGNYSQRIFLGSINYEDDSGDFQPINTTIVPSSKPNWDWEVTTGHWKLFVNNDTTVGVKKGNNWIGTRLHGIAYYDASIKDYTILQTTNTVTPVVSSNSITWYNILYGVDYVLHYTNDSLKEEIVIHQEARDLLSSAGHRPSDYGYATSDTYLVPIFECDWSQGLPMKLSTTGPTVSPNELETNNAIYFEADTPDPYWNTKLVSFLPVYMATSVNPINPEDPEKEWEYAECVMKKKLVLKNDKRWLLTGALVLELNSMPEGSIILDPTETLRPSAAGSETGLGAEAPAAAAHWTCVDEAVANDADWVGCYVVSAWQQDLYSIPDSSVGEGIINSVKIWTRINGHQASDRDNFQIILQSGGTVYEGTLRRETTAGYTNYSDTWVDNPADAEDWDWADIDALQIGIRLRQGKVHADPGYYQTFCSQTYAEVNYTVVPPTVTTQDASDIAETTATGNGNITAIGAESCDKRGIVYGTATQGDPGAAAPPGGYDDFEEESPGPFGTGPFTRALTGLTPDETYYARAYAHNSAGYNYGSEISFNTNGPPLVTTNAASLVEETTATLNGEITDVNGANATTRGFEWDIDAGAPYANDWHQDGTYGVEAFTRAISSLTKGELYYYRAYAINTYGTRYGAEVTFLTKPDPPNTLVATSDSTQIDLTWSKPASADKTYIVRKDGSYPADRADGVNIYNDTLELYSDVGLTGGHTYYYKAWSWCTEGGKEQFSDNYDFAFATPGLTLKLWYQPITIVVSTNHDGVADAGSDNNTIIDDTLTQANDYWIGALVTITGAGAAAPEGETRVCTAYALATTEITVAPVFSAAVEVDDTYTIDFGTLVDRQVNSGTASAGSAIMLRSAVLTEANDFWNGIIMEILTTTDGLAPQGESAVVTDFIAADDELQFAALTAVVGAGDTFELRSDGRITWGVNPTGISVTVGGLESAGIVAPAAAEEPEIPSILPSTPDVDLITESAGSNIPLIAPIFELAVTLTGWPIFIFWYVGSISLAAILGALVLIYLHSMLVSALAVSAVLALACTIDGGVISWNVLYIYLIMALAFVVYQRVHSVA